VEECNRVCGRNVKPNVTHTPTYVTGSATYTHTPPEGKKSKEWPLSAIVSFVVSLVIIVALLIVLVVRWRSADNAKHDFDIYSRSEIQESLI
jgi:hypothetical protein